jgi:hypothetical protein
VTSSLLSRHASRSASVLPATAEHLVRSVTYRHFRNAAGEEGTHVPGRRAHLRSPGAGVVGRSRLGWRTPRAGPLRWCGQACATLGCWPRTAD